MVASNIAYSKASAEADMDSTLLTIRGNVEKLLEVFRDAGDKMKNNNNK